MIKTKILTVIIWTTWVNIKNGTEPFIPDTDEDGLLDGDEVHIYGTTDEAWYWRWQTLDGEEGHNGTIYAKYEYIWPTIPDTDND